MHAAIEMFHNHLLHPFAIYKQIRDTIAFEEQSVGFVCGYQITWLDNEAIGITQKLNNLKTQVQTIKERQTNYKHEIENFKVLEYREKLTQTVQVTSALEEERRLAILEDHQRKIGQIIEVINARLIDLNQSFANVIFQIDDVQKLLICNRLNKWHRDQALAGNGAPLNKNSLDENQLWFEKLAEIILTIRCSIEATREINKSIPLNAGNETEQAFNKVTTLMQNLIKSGFIVEIQPPQVLRADAKFTATVRLLIANLGIQLNNPSVLASFYFASQSSLKSQNCEILNNTGKLDIQPSTYQLSCTFNNMKLNKFKRTNKNEGVKVTDEKYALIFESTFLTADIEINVSVTTLPIVVIVHTYQEPQSWATITWDNAFSQIGREPFYVTNTANWSDLVGALNMKFVCETDTNLATDSAKYLYEKAFGANFDCKDQQITWNQFCKAPLPRRTFTFWDWFYSVKNLIRNNVHGLWTDGLIIGFIDRRQTVEKLRLCPAGTFLIRFSESELGSVSIALVNDNTSPSNVVMLQPFYSYDLKIRSLADRIRDIDQCVTLYTNTPKDVAFNKHYSPTIEGEVNGYVQVLLKTTIPYASTHVCSCIDNYLQLGIQDLLEDFAS